MRCYLVPDPALSVQFLRSTLDTALGTFGDLAEYVIVTRNGDECHAVASEFDAELLNIPLNRPVCRARGPCQTLDDLIIARVV